MKEFNSTEIKGYTAYMCAGPWPSIYDTQMNKKLEMVFKQIPNYEFVVVLMHRELEDSGHVFEKQKQSLGFFEVWANPFKILKISYWGANTYG